MNAARFLEWDTQFFGVRIASIELERIGEHEWHAALEFCRAQRIECLYVLAEAAEDLRFPAGAGAREVDRRLTLETSGFAAPAPDPRIRTATEADLPALRALAARSHRDSRFYADPGFARERCDELYATWIEKSVRGWADVVFTSGAPGQPLGYLSWHARAWHSQIGLVAVAEEARGKGLGRALVAAALIRAAPARQPLQVVTQARNDAAAALYSRCGFELRRTQCWYHLWFQ